MKNDTSSHSGSDPEFNEWKKPSTDRSTPIATFAGHRLVYAVIVGLFASMVLAETAAAQDPVDAFSRLTERVNVGTTIFVIDEKGEGTKGKITDLSATSLQLATGGSRDRTLTFPADRVWHVTRVDSQLNGFVIGAIAGAVPGILIGV